LFVIGVDENGLGPVLGPLVVTGVGLSLSRYAPDRHGALGRELGIDDSKATAAFGKVGRAEGLALAVFEALWGSVPGHVDELFARLLRRPLAELQGACPGSTRPQCWAAEVALPCFGGDVQAGRDTLAGLAARGIRVCFAQSEAVCTSDLNRRLERGQSRVEVDLEAMELLLCDARAALAEELVAICGMVGGIRNYPERFRHFRRDAVAPRRTQAQGLAYAVEGVGRVTFEIDADQRHLPVALASMIGKYVRELWMERQNAFYRPHFAAAADVSGYHDPVTRRFIEASAQLRGELAIADACFVRRSAKDERQKNQLPLFG
jgi:ribonuclease HII